ncbi:MAG: hypothetical protein WC360_07840 [Opitutales bacterium]|jgi:hypothetical protein
MNKFDRAAHLGNGLTSMNRLFVTGACSLFLFASQANAQRYTLRKPPELKNEFSVGFSMLSPATVSFGNLGNIAGQFNQDGVYNDAFVAPDDSASTAADGKTYYFAFQGIEQITDASGNPAFNGEYVKASAARAVAKDGIFVEEGDSGNDFGTELQYVRYMTRARKFGFLASLSLTGFSMARSTSWDVDIIGRADLYKGENIDALDGFSGSYMRPRVFSPGQPEVYLSLDPIHLGEYAIGEGTASGAWDVKASYLNLRLGGVYNMSLTRRINLRAGGGLVAVLASSNFRWAETFTAPFESGSISVNDSGIDHKKTFLFGGWADLGAHYRINRNVTAFGSVEYQATTSFEQDTPGGPRIEFDSSSLFYAKTGFTWAF